MQTVGDITAQTPHFSFFWRRVQQLAGERGAHAWLIDEANRRGYWGASNTGRPDVPVTAEISDEQLAIGLLMPHAEADARTWKLVVRMLQSGKLRVPALAFLARAERAEFLLYWLVQQIPAPEVNEAIAALRQALKSPRGAWRVRYDYDASRLIRRPASKDNLWRPKQS